MLVTAAGFLLRCSSGLTREQENRSSAEWTAQFHSEPSSAAASLQPGVLKTFHITSLHCLASLAGAEKPPRLDTPPMRPEMHMNPEEC
jgi:hypothetical protein